jgi:hypothetical protein
VFFTFHDESLKQQRRLVASRLGWRLSTRRQFMFAKCIAWVTFNENGNVLNSCTHKGK